MESLFFEIPNVSKFPVCFSNYCILPVDGHWNRWSAWNCCSNSCGTGTRSRVRVCDDPPPANGGQSCPTDEEGDMQTESCVSLTAPGCGRGNEIQFLMKGCCDRLNHFKVYR